jgi:hypothetical protein
LWDVRRVEPIIAGWRRSTSASAKLALNLVGILVRTGSADNHIDRATQQCIEGFSAIDLPQEIAGCARWPVWATPPFLHNGSVPTLYQSCRRNGATGNSSWDDASSIRYTSAS